MKRLARLLAVRQVRLRTAARQLGEAGALLGQLRATRHRLIDLRGDLAAGDATDGYAAKATAATRAALGDAAGHQTQRVGDAERRHAASSATAQRHRAAADAVERALAQLSLPPRTDEPQPVKRQRR